MLRSLVCVGFVLLLAQAWPDSAAACSGFECAPTRFFPWRGSVPANIPGFAWWPVADLQSGDDAGLSDDELADSMRLARTDGAQPESLEFELRPLAVERFSAYNTSAPYLVVPKQPLEVGATYMLWSLSGCRGPVPAVPPMYPADPFAFDLVSSEIARVEVIAPATLPDALGTLSVRERATGRVMVPDGSGCSGPITANYRDLVLALDVAARPWADALFYETVVDGKRYNPLGDVHGVDLQPGSPLVGRPGDRIYTVCAPADQPYNEGVAQGGHDARLRASIPGSEIRLQTDEVSFELSCDQASGPDGGMPGLDSGSEPPADAAPRDRDASDRDASDRAVPRKADDDGCRVAETTSTPRWTWWLALAFWLVARRRDR